MSFSECVDIVDGRPLRQGDVVRSLAARPDPWEDLAIIVTTDCDIARGKHAGRLTCVPVLPAQAYLSAYYLPRRIEKLQRALADRFVPSMRKAQSAHFDGFREPISFERAQRWILEASPSRVSSTLRMIPEEAQRFVPLAEAFVRLDTSRSGHFPGQIGTICDSEVLLGRSPDDASACKRIRAELASHVNELPGDALFLRSLGSTSTAGYVAYLRVLLEVRDSCVAVKSTQRSSEIKYERIARLQAPYVYALTQQLASVFSAIALPREYEESRGECGQALIPIDEGH
jgi:hypothetical protein